MSQIPWTCPNCGSPPILNEEPTECEEMEQLHDSRMSRVKCTSCDKSVAVAHRGRLHSLEMLLTDRLKTAKGCYSVQTESDRLVLFTLSQIIYKELEAPQENLLEFEFDLPPPTDLAKILWIDGEAAGFYSVKPKGTLDMETLQTYAMPTLDTIFIRQTYRRQGLASLAVQDVSSTFPHLDIGFSYPISLAMLKVLGKHLEERAEDRPRFWEITGCGREGNCRNLWLILQRQRKKVA
ncbi:unnamed protein product [Allacma fusca]|uniref:N-acetyltransferase domain-containing protein n=1 Tax=Allacma fusca TaxID=39272 RepID=A0A8J2PU31_9HEXA|nr:unnamed protein product [Allacma fusca]